MTLLYILSARLSHITHLFFCTICDCSFPKFLPFSINHYQVLNNCHQWYCLIHFCAFLSSFKSLIYIHNILSINSIDNIFTYVNINMCINDIIPLIWLFEIVYYLLYYIRFFLFLRNVIGWVGACSCHCLIIIQSWRRAPWSMVIIKWVNLWLTKMSPENGSWLRRSVALELD